MNAETEAAFTQLVKARAAHETALKAAQRRRDEFEDRVARAPSARHPSASIGTRSPAASRARRRWPPRRSRPTGLHRLMERYRKRHPAPDPKPKPKPRGTR